MVIEDAFGVVGPDGGVDGTKDAGVVVGLGKDGLGDDDAGDLRDARLIVAVVFEAAVGEARPAPVEEGVLALSAGMMGSSTRTAAWRRPNSASSRKGRFRWVLCRLDQPWPRQSNRRL